MELYSSEIRSINYHVIVNFCEGLERSIQTSGRPVLFICYVVFMLTC